MSENESTVDVSRVEITKVSEELGLVFGWAIICKKGGEDYFDLQGHHIPEDVMLEAALDFMKNSRMAGEMHERDDAGTVPFCMPMTEEVKKAYGIECDKTGLMFAMAPDAEMLKRFKSGDLSAFSIGGSGRLEEVKDA